MHYACKMFFFQQLALLATAPTIADYPTLRGRERKAAAGEIEGLLFTATTLKNLVGRNEY